MSEVSSGASRPIEAMVWFNETESAKSVADLKKSDTITGSKLQTNSEVLGSEMASGLKRIIHQRRLQKKSLHSRGSCTKRNKVFPREGKSHG